MCYTDISCLHCHTVHGEYYNISFMCVSVLGSLFCAALTWTRAYRTGSACNILKATEKPCALMSSSFLLKPISQLNQQWIISFERCSKMYSQSLKSFEAALTLVKDSLYVPLFKDHHYIQCISQQPFCISLS